MHPNARGDVSARGATCTGRWAGRQAAASCSVGAAIMEAAGTAGRAVDLFSERMQGACGH
jgi:hypothetical protein